MVARNLYGRRVHYGFLNSIISISVIHCQATVHTEDPGTCDATAASVACPPIPNLPTCEKAVMATSSCCRSAFVEPALDREVFGQPPILYGHGAYHGPLICTGSWKFTHTRHKNVVLVVYIVFRWILACLSFYEGE
ncbi:hypothetical protein T440DRAFT_465420 [Plenodomus tracheiphilus IPT5]|uniref:Uncharacterized protein n=1 Tax=Plenodomus tracheiphilus IPT5 TaxID=1408161 RepID=A0A6A7BGR9_9PLEO|nr:hypothetical protein T440DRAFT_465420 [Plenodomus tracheiphilus IPT5]